MVWAWAYGVVGAVTFLWLVRGDPGGVGPVRNVVYSVVCSMAWPLVWLAVALMWMIAVAARDS